MKCPKSYSSDIMRFQQDCEKTECAWWDRDRNMCDISIAARSLRLIAEELQQLRRHLVDGE